MSHFNLLQNNLWRAVSPLWWMSGVCAHQAGQVWPVQRM